MDFTLKKYKSLLTSFLDAGYSFQTVEEFLQFPKEKVVILRHDVDLKAINALYTAKIEHGLGIKASYYFRFIPQSNQPTIIKEIVSLGHEIGYHYEDLSLFRGDKTRAIQHFEKQLTHFRQFYPIQTICMHGSPTSKIDNRTIWQYVDYRVFGIIAEPYFDIDFNKVFYLTDTGRRWDGDRFSVRDKVSSTYNLSFRKTSDIIDTLKRGELPIQIMINTHPQRWTNNKIEWYKELILQNIKNIVKSLLINQINNQRSLTKGK